MAANADVYNRQLHPQEEKWIKETATIYAKQQGMTVDEAAGVLTAQAHRQVQNGAPGAWDANASAFLTQTHGMLPAEGNSGPGYMFYATPEQKANPNMYAGYYADGVGVMQPSADEIAKSVNRESAYRDAYTKGTWGAAGGAATVAIAGPAAVIPGAPIFSTGGALGSSTWASPVGTGAISATINAGDQYIQNGAVNPIALAGAFATGAAGLYGGLLWNIGVNAAGGATTTALNNVLLQKNDSVLFGGLAAGTTSAFGYGIGKSMGTAIDSASRPTINSSGWAAPGQWAGQAGWNLLGPNNLPTIGSSVGGGFGTEFGGSVVNRVKESNK
jgi:hypothetical protein